jgi:hypothetical protein
MSESVSAVTQSVLESIRKEYNLKEPVEEEEINKQSEEDKEPREDDDYYPNSSSNEETAGEYYTEKVADNERLVEEDREHEELHTASSSNEEEKAIEPMIANFQAQEQRKEIKSILSNINEEMQQKIEIVESKLQEIRIRSDIENFSIESRHQIEKIMMIQSMDEPDEVLAEEMDHETDEQAAEVATQDQQQQQQNSSSAAEHDLTDNEAVQVEEEDEPVVTQSLLDNEEGAELDDSVNKSTLRSENNEVSFNTNQTRKLSLSQTRLISGSDSDLNVRPGDIEDEYHAALESTSNLQQTSATGRDTDDDEFHHQQMLNKSKQYQTFESSSSSSSSVESDLNKREKFVQEDVKKEKFESIVHLDNSIAEPQDEPAVALPPSLVYEPPAVSSSETEEVSNTLESVGTSLNVPVSDLLASSDSSQQLLLEDDADDHSASENNPILPTLSASSLSYLPTPDGKRVSSSSYTPVQQMTPTNERDGSVDDVSITTVIERRLSRQEQESVTGALQEDEKTRTPTEETRDQRSSLEISSEGDQTDEENQLRRTARHGSYYRRSADETKNKQDEGAEEKTADEDAQSNRTLDEEELQDRANLLDSDASVEENDEPVVVYTISTIKKVENEQEKRQNDLTQATSSTIQQDLPSEQARKDQVTELKSNLHLNFSTSGQTSSVNNDLVDLLGGFSDSTRIESTHVKCASEEKDDYEAQADDDEVAKHSVVDTLTNVDNIRERVIPMRRRDLSESPFQNSSSNCTGSQLSVSTTSEENLRQLSYSRINRSDASSLTSVNNNVTDETLVIDNLGNDSDKNPQDNTDFMCKSLNYLTSLVDPPSTNDFNKEIDNYVQDFLASTSGEKEISPPLTSNTSQSQIVTTNAAIIQQQRPTDMGALFMRKSDSSYLMDQSDQTQTPTPVENIAGGNFFDKRVTSSNEPSLDHVTSASETEADADTLPSMPPSSNIYNVVDANKSAMPLSESYSSMSERDDLGSRSDDAVAERLVAQIEASETSVSEVAAAMATALLFSSTVKSQSSDEIKSQADQPDSAGQESDSELATSSNVTKTQMRPFTKYIVLGSQHEDNEEEYAAVATGGSGSMNESVFASSVDEPVTNASIDAGDTSAQAGDVTLRPTHGFDNPGFASSSHEEDEDKVSVGSNNSQKSMIINQDYDDTEDQNKLGAKVKIVTMTSSVKASTTIAPFSASTQHAESEEVTEEETEEENINSQDKAATDDPVLDIDQAYLVYSGQSSSNHSLENELRSANTASEEKKMLSIDLAEQIVDAVLEHSVTRLMQEEDEAEQELIEHTKAVNSISQHVDYAQEEKLVELISAADQQLDKKIIAAVFEECLRENQQQQEIVSGDEQPASSLDEAMVEEEFIPTASDSNDIQSSTDLVATEEEKEVEIHQKDSEFYRDLLTQYSEAIKNDEDQTIEKTEPSRIVDYDEEKLGDQASIIVKNTLTKSMELLTATTTGVTISNANVSSSTSSPLSPPSPSGQVQSILKSAQSESSGNMYHQKSSSSLVSTIDEQLKSSYSPKEVRFSSNLILSDSNEGSTDQSSEDSQIQHEQPQQLQPAQQVVVIVEATPTTSPTLITAAASSSIDTVNVDAVSSAADSVEYGSATTAYFTSSNIDDEDTGATSTGQIVGDSEELCQLQALIMNANYKNTFTLINDNESDSVSGIGSRQHSFRHQHDAQSSMDENEEESTNSETTLEKIAEEQLQQQDVSPGLSEVLPEESSVDDVDNKQHEKVDELVSAANELTLIAQQHSAEVVQSAVAVAIVETSISNAVDLLTADETNEETTESNESDEEKKKKKLQSGCKEDEIGFKDKKDDDDDDDEDKGPKPEGDQARISAISSEASHSSPVEASQSDSTTNQQHDAQHESQTIPEQGAQEVIVEASSNDLDNTQNVENAEVEQHESVIDEEISIRSAPFNNEHLFDSEDPKPLLTSSFMGFDGKLPGEETELEESKANEEEAFQITEASIISSSSDITFHEVNNHGLSKEEEDEDKLSNKTLEENVNNTTTTSSSKTQTSAATGKNAEDAVEIDDSSSTCSFFTATSSIQQHSVHSVKLQNQANNNLIKQESVQTNQTGATNESGSYYVTANEYNSSSSPFSATTTSNLPKSASSQLRFEQNISQTQSATKFASSAMTTSDSFHTALDLLSSKASSISNSRNIEHGYDNEQSINSSYSGYSSDTFASLNTSFASSNQTLSATATDNEDNEDDCDQNTTIGENENETTLDDEADKSSVSTVTSFASNVNQNSSKTRLAMSESDVNLGQFNVEYFLKNMHSLVSENLDLTTTGGEKIAPVSNTQHQDPLVITGNSNLITANIYSRNLNQNESLNRNENSTSKNDFSADIDVQSNSGTHSTLTNNDAVEDIIENVVTSPQIVAASGIQDEKDTDSDLYPSEKILETDLKSSVLNNVEEIIETKAVELDQNEPQIADISPSESTTNFVSSSIPHATQINSGSSNDSKNGSDNVSCTSSVLEFERLEAQCDLEDEVMGNANNSSGNFDSNGASAIRRLRETGDIYENIEEEDESVLDFENDAENRRLNKQSSLEEFVLATQHRDLNTIYESFEKEPNATSSSEAGLNDSTTIINNNKDDSNNLSNKEENEYVIVDDLKKATVNETTNDEFVMIENSEVIPAGEAVETAASVVEVPEPTDGKSVDNSTIVNHVTIEPASPIPPLRSSQTIDESSGVDNFSEIMSDKRRDSEPAVVNKPVKSDLSLISRLTTHSIQSSPMNSSPNTPSSSKPKSLSIAHTPSSSSENNSSPLSHLPKNSLLFAQHSLSSSNASLRSTDSYENELKTRVKLDETSFFARRQLEKQNKNSSSQQSGSSRNSIASQKDEVTASTSLISKIPVLISSRKNSAAVAASILEPQIQASEAQNDMEASQITLKSSMHVSDSGQSSMTASLVSSSQLQSPLADISSTSNNNVYRSNSSSNNGSNLVSLDSAYSFLSSSQSGSMLAATSSYMSDLAANASGSASSSYIAQQQQHVEMRESLSSNSLSGGGTRTKKTSRRQSRTSSSASSSSSTSLNNDSKYHQQTIHHVLSGLSGGAANQKTVFTAEDLPSFRKMATSPAPGSNTSSNNNSGASKPTSNTASPTTDSIPVNISNLSSGSNSKINSIISGGGGIKNSNLATVGSTGVGHSHGHTSNCYCLGGAGKKTGQDEQADNK